MATRGWRGWRQGGGIWKGAKGEMGRGAIGTGSWQWRGGQGEEEMERGAIGKGGGKMGRGQREGEKGKKVGMGRGRRSKRSRDFTDGYDGMLGWTRLYV